MATKKFTLGRHFAAAVLKEILLASFLHFMQQQIHLLQALRLFITPVSPQLITISLPNIQN